MEKSSHEIAQTINATPEAAWEIIGSGKDVDKWLAPITSCKVEGNKRYCTTAEGGFEEDILEINDQERVFRYAIPSQHMIPVENIEAYMQVKPAENGRSTLVWHWDFEAEETNIQVAKEAFAQVGGMGINGIETLILG